nr:pentatricopeptide repeat-containing protein [Tanacetum cinerariifolium]
MLKGESRFQVVSLVDEHACVRNFNYGRLVNYKWIGRNFTDKIKMNIQITIDAIVDLVMKKYKGIVSRTQCRNAKTFASNEGDAAIQDHCGLHRSYAKALVDSNEELLADDLELPNGNGLTIMYDQHKICAAKSSTIAVPELNALRLKGNHNNVRVHRSHRHEEDEHHETVDGKWIVDICPNIHKILELSKDQQGLWHVIPCGGNNFEVRKGCKAFSNYQTLLRIHNHCMVLSCHKPDETHAENIAGTQQSQVFGARVGETSNEPTMTQGTRTIKGARNEGTGTKEAVKESDKASTTFAKPIIRSKKSLTTSARGGRTVIKGKMTKCAVSLRATRTIEP